MLPPPTLAPADLRVGARYLRADSPVADGADCADFATTLVVIGYPREMWPGWLEPLTGLPFPVAVSVHIGALDPVTASSRLRRRLARLESGLRSDSEHGRLRDPYAEAATEDAYLLADRIARGETRLFTVGLSITVHAPSEAVLAARVQQVRALAAGLLLDARPTTYRALAGWISGLPLGVDRLGQQRSFDTDALAACFPMACAELPAPAADTAALLGAPPAGVLYGHSLGSRSLVFWDRFACDNYNAVVLGRSGAGKSYLVKLELLRSLYRGIHAHVIDPEDEYVRLTAAVGGAVLRLGAPGVHLNPLDLPLSGPDRDGTRTAPRDALTRRALFLHTVLDVLLDSDSAARSLTAGCGGNGGPRGGLSPWERSVLDTAVTATYTRAGITDDPTTWIRPAPLLADLRDTLTAMAHHPTNPLGPASGGAGAAVGERKTAARLAALLHPFTDGAFRELFRRPTSTRPHAHLVVWALRELPEPLRPIGTLLALDAIWAQVTDPSERRRRLVVVDEAWLLMQQPAGAAFLLRAAKSGRKHWAGLTIATQDTADVLGTDLGHAVVANAATQILLRQAPQAIDTVVDAFGLSQGEAAFLLSADRGHALLTAGRHRVALYALAADVEHDLITTDPAFLAEHPDRHRGGDRIVLLDDPPSPRRSRGQPTEGGRS
jgi:hypothetical protein